MSIFSIKSIKLRIFHTGKRPFLSISHGELQASVPADEAATLVGVNRQTLSRWAHDKHRAPVSALHLFAIVYLGLMPWPGFENIRVKRFQEHYGMVSDVWPARVFIESWRLDYLASDLDDTQHLKREILMLRATVTALSTRQPPPIPCAEIIQLNHYQEKTPHNST